MSNYEKLCKEVKEILNDLTDEEQSEIIFPLSIDKWSAQVLVDHIKSVRKFNKKAREAEDE